MVITADSVVALAKSIRSLSEAQMQRIQDVVHFMDDADLKQLNTMLEKAKTKEVEDMKKELELRKKVAAANAEWQADKAREKSQKAETASQEHDEEEAEALIQNL